MAEKRHEFFIAKNDEKKAQWEEKKENAVKDGVKAKARLDQVNLFIQLFEKKCPPRSKMAM